VGYNVFQAADQNLHQPESINQLLSSKSFSSRIKGCNLWTLHTDPTDGSELTR